MARNKGALATRKRRKSILKAAKGYWAQNQSTSKFYRKKSTRKSTLTEMVDNVRDSVTV